MNGKILLFQITDGAILSKIQLVAQRENIQLRPVEQGEYHKTVGQLAMLPPSREMRPSAPLTEPMMVLCMPSERLDNVLTELRHMGVPPICKAILTQTNAGWTPTELLSELQRERAEFMNEKNGSRC